MLRHCPPDLTVDAAVSNSFSDFPLLVPAKNTEALTAAVSTSLGPPQTIPSGPVIDLANKAIENRADLDHRV